MQQVTAYEAGHGTSLKGRLALVTGASSGIGHAVALALARQGMELLLVGRRKDALRSVAEQAGRANIVVADLASAPGRQLVVDAVPPMLHVLVHSAGIYFRGAVLATMGETWAALDALNLHAPLLLTAACSTRPEGGAGAHRLRELDGRDGSCRERRCLCCQQARVEGRGGRLAARGKP